MRLRYCLPLLPAALVASLWLLAFASTVFIWPRPGPAVAESGLAEIETVLSNLPNNAAWQGVANDGEYFYLLTSQNTSKNLPKGKENIIRKYRISDGQLVAVKNDAYPNARRFSSGEVIDGKLYVAVRDASVTSTWAHVVIYNTTDLTVLEDHDIAATQGYAVPEGVAKEDGYFWVIFGGAGGGSGNVRVSAVVKYDLAWNEVAAYQLFTLPSGNYFGGQDIIWINDNEIVTNMHEDKFPGEDKFDRWRWNGDGFTRVARYDQLADDTTHTMGQGFTALGGYLYFAARYSDRLVKAQLLDSPKPTAMATPTPTPTPTDTPIPTPGACPDFDGDTLCDDVDADDDNDGCTDAAELQPKSLATLGGGRDPHYYWDFMDQWVSKEKDRRVNIIDIAAIVNRFGAAGDPSGDPQDPPQELTGYHVSADRSPPIGPNVWNAGPPDGNINIIEIGLAVVQFGHSCAGSP